MGRLHVTIVVVQKQKVSHILRVCICSLRYSACNAYAQFCPFFFSARLFSAFPNYLIKGMIFGRKNLLNIKCAF